MKNASKMEQHKKTYIGITFGPITRVADMAKSTKAVWATSYIFSYIAKNIVAPFCFEKDRKFLLPQWLNPDPNLKQEDKEEEKVDTKAKLEQKIGVGLFPDRYIFEACEGDFEDLERKKDEVFEELAKKICDKNGGLGVKDEEKEFVKNEIKNSFKVFFIEKELEGGDKEIVDDLTSYLDVLDSEDLFCEWQNGQKRGYLKDLMELRDSFLIKDAFGDEWNKEKNRLFDTILEYSAQELNLSKFRDEYNTKKSKESDYKKSFEEYLEPYFEPYHKYIAVVKADGDYMNDTLTDMVRKNIPIYKLDSNLLKYNLEVGNIIKDYGGAPIFLGGDDLLFFAPIIGNGEIDNSSMSIFGLLDKINTKFIKHMSNIGLGDDLKLTLSFGMAITYYKFPFTECRKLAEELLCQSKDSGKNKIVWQLRKHSGQLVEGVMDKSESDKYAKSIEFINTFYTKARERDEEKKEKKLYSSFVYWLRSNEEIISYALGDSSGVKLNNYFKNSFDEQVHLTENFKNFTNKVFELLLDGVNIKDIYSMLRFVLFVKNGE